MSGLFSFCLKIILWNISISPKSFWCSNAFAKKVDLDIKRPDILFVSFEKRSLMPFGWILNKIAGDYNEKELAKIRPLIQKINNFYEDRHTLSDDQIKAKTQEFKERLAKGESLDSLLPEAFATVKQACKRMVGMPITVKGDSLTRQMVPYDVQLIG